MPRIRCRYYDERGSPLVEGGCRNNDCYFVHPSEPAWFSAPMPRSRLYPNDKHNRGRDRDWGGGGNNRRHEGNVSPTRDVRPPVSGSNRLPTAPRSMMESASASDWGAAFGGSAWGTTNDETASAGTSASSAVPDMSFGGGRANAISGGGWGTTESETVTAGGWGAPPGLWDDVAPSTASARAPSTSLRVSTAGWGELPSSNDKGKGKEKEKEKETVPAPAAASPSASTPTFAFATPRTPRSPMQSPVRDPRHKPAASTGPASASTSTARSSTDYAAVAAQIANESRGSVRITSFGVPIPITTAGAQGATPSKPNPFHFPAYVAPERMDVEEEGAVLEVGTTYRAQSRSASPAPAPPKELPTNLEERWKGFLNTFQRAVYWEYQCYLSLKTRQNESRLQRCLAYQSGSLVGAHTRISEMRKSTEDRLHRAQRKRTEYIKELMRYPLEGLPAPGNDPRRRQLEEVQEYYAEMMAWKDSVQPIVDDFRALCARLEDERTRADEERRKAEEQAQAQARAAGQLPGGGGKSTPVSPTGKTMEEIAGKVEDVEARLDDLKRGFDEMRQSAPRVEDVVKSVLEENGIPLRAPSPRRLGTEGSRQSLEDGEMPYETPPPPKTNAELTEMCEKLGKMIVESKADAARHLEQIDAWKQRNYMRERGYHELAADTSELAVTVGELTNARKRYDEKLEEHDKALKELQALLQRCEAERPAPPPPPPTVEEISEQLKPHILPSLREDVQRGLQGLKLGVTQGLQSVEEQTCVQLYKALQPASDIVDEVRRWLAQQPGAPVPPNSAPPHPAPVPMQSVQH